jgi:TP901 family phage tail tape measure protein
MAYSVSYQYRIDDRYTRPMKAIKKATSKFREVADKTSQSIKKMGSRIGGLESIAAGAAGAIGGATLINKFIGFEEQINATAAVLNATEDQFLSLKKTAIDLGSTTKFTAAEASAGMLMLAKNGLKLEDTMKGIPGVLSLSAATGADLSLAADLATDVMANFGAKASELPDIMNKITGATVTSKFDIQKLTFALANSTAQARETGVSFLETITALTSISSSFASGERAGTSFAIFLRRLIPKTTEQIKMMKALGMMTANGQNAFLDASGSVKSLGEVSDILSNKLSGLTKAQRSLALETIFGSDAMRAASAFADVGSKKFAELASEINKVDAGEIARKRMQGLVGSVKLLGSALDSLVIKILDSGIDDLIAGVADAITGIANAIGNTAPWVRMSIGIIGILAATLLPLVATLKVLMVVLSPLGALLVPLGATLKVIAAIFVGMSIPIWGTVAAVTALVAGLALIITKWEQIKAIFANIPKVMKHLGTFGAVEDTALLGGEGPGIAAANAKAMATASTLNGRIDINAPPGVVKNTALETSTPGDLGMNLAGAF